jgi:4-alpha-glucanotransferase
MKRRGSGILCHITSLPSPYGIGDLGPEAYAFADFLSEADQSYWQILPLNPTNERYAFSPFSTMSSCAGNTMVISPDSLVQEELLTQQEAEDHPEFPVERVDFPTVHRFKQHLFRKAHSRFREREADDADYQRFCSGHASWLEDHAFFSAIYEHLGNAPLVDWPEEIKGRRPEALEPLHETLSDDIHREKFLQYTFYKQALALRNYCNKRSIHLIGDFPLFINYDSVDIWIYPEIFKVDQEKKAYVVAGAPPDDFSPEGQIFNCAVYNWDTLKESGFTWWIRRFHYLFKLYDYVRIDHFRGLISYWEVPAGDKNALNGKWVPAMVNDFTNALMRHFPTFPVLAEDLGTITAEVREAMAVYDIPGLKILVLGFENVDFESVYLPHNHVPHSVVYTGTHDTRTVMGWYTEGSEEDREVFGRYLGKKVGDDVNWDFIRVAMMSVSNTAIIQMQDVLGSKERMNYPGRAEGNWLWRFAPEGYRQHARTLSELTKLYGRSR